MIYQEVSAKAGTGIEKLFELTASRVIERWKQDPNFMRKAGASDEGMDFKL